jgi:hypothetical protein
VPTTTEAPASPELEFTNDMSVILPTSSGSVRQSVQSTVHKAHSEMETTVTSQAEHKTTPNSESEGGASLLSWNSTTLCVFIILPIALGVAVFLALIATSYITKKCTLHPPQHETQRTDRHVAGLFSRVPLLNPQLTEDHTKQTGYLNRSRDSFSSAQYHVYEQID